MKTTTITVANRSWLLRNHAVHSAGRGEDPRGTKSRRVVDGESESIVDHFHSPFLTLIFRQEFFQSMQGTIASSLGVDELTTSQIINRTASLGWWVILASSKFTWAGLIWFGQLIEKNSKRVHRWASTSRHLRGTINNNAGNMIRQARNALQPADKWAMGLSIIVAALYHPYGLLLPVATYIVFFHDADELKASSTILGYLGIGVSAVLNIMMFAAALVSSNRWRKGQFRD